eukprot:8032095-Lingulodinium_polyedra.AAC.1
MIDDISSAKHKPTYCPHSSSSTKDVLSMSACSIGTGVVACRRERIVALACEQHGLFWHRVNWRCWNLH